MQSILQIATAVYLPIIAAALVGVLLSLGLTRTGRMVRDQPVQELLPDVLARVLYLVGIPIGVANFIRKAEFNPSVWISPVIAWSAVLLAIFLSWHFLKSSAKPRAKSTKASFVLLSYLGNTSYLGFPVILLLPQLGPQYFSSAVLYDILGTLVAGYGLGVFIAGQASQNNAEVNSALGSRGSGGINKMLVVGIGCLNCIRITHTMEVLSHALTRPGEANNHFVKLLDHFTTEILSQLRGKSGRLKTNPIGVSVLAKKTDQPDCIWIGDQDKNRSVLTKQLEMERTVTLDHPVSFVIIDTERRKATDILAGARSLHFLCSFDDPSNQLLRSRPACRSALMFNACHEAKNSNGIGNAGTLLHLNALRSFVHESITEARDRGLIAVNNTLSDNKRRIIKKAILARWEEYLRLVSNEDDFFARVESLLIRIISAKNNIQDKAPLLEELAHSLDESFAHSFGNHRHVITGTRHHFAHSGARDALLFLQQSTNALGFKGLGEGGQRALRLLVILQKFDTLYIATDNQHVLQFLAELNHPPGISNIDQPSGRSLIGPEPNILGLTGISLNDHSPQAALQLALDQHHDQTIPFNGSELAFIQEPVIIKRDLIQEFKTAAMPSTTVALEATRMYS